MPFELFDPQGDLQITAGHLPHWYQPGVTYFITFRTDDSLPIEVAELCVGTNGCCDKEFRPPCSKSGAI